MLDEQSFEAHVLIVDVEPEDVETLKTVLIAEIANSPGTHFHPDLAKLFLDGVCPAILVAQKQTT